MKKWIYRLLIVIIIIIAITFITLHLLIRLSSKSNPDRNSEYLIVLGARVYGKTPSPSLSFRLEEALKYLDKNTNTKVVCSGGMGPGEDITEAEAMKRYFISKGIEEARIIKEESSTNTFENIKYSKIEIEGSSTIFDEKVIIVTNGYHLFRAKLIAKRLGLKATGLAAKTPTSVIIKSYFREYLAIIKTLILDH